ncbi:MAG TPA: acid phosphatase, partial [Anaerolineaceae bacterium]|nr:acid phosphatase [Anaerolineaceae bacterium]
VIYDAAGVRRQAGFHAQKINIVFEELFHGRPIPQERLIEVLGHTPRQVLGGILLGLVITLVVYAVWPPLP